MCLNKDTVSLHVLCSQIETPSGFFQLLVRVAELGTPGVDFVSQETRCRRFTHESLTQTNSCGITQMFNDATLYTES